MAGGGTVAGIAVLGSAPASNDRHPQGSWFIVAGARPSELGLSWLPPGTQPSQRSSRKDERIGVVTGEHPNAAILRNLPKVFVAADRDHLAGLTATADSARPFSRLQPGTHDGISPHAR
jgi:hypothetical protein